MHCVLTKLFVLLLLFTLYPGSSTLAQEGLDGPQHQFKDPLLDNLVGQWKLKRKIGTRTAENSVTVDWVLNHQFLRIQMKDVNSPPEYEAMIFIGYDNASERYVVHWLDLFGGRFSETLGFGVRTGNSIKFVFEYPDGPFHNSFTWYPQTRSWRFLMQNKNKEGKWVTFAEDSLTKK